jgi:hypothetical protein
METEHPYYEAYRQHTAMFIPGDPGGKLFRIFFSWIKNRSAARAVSAAVVTVLVMGSGLCLRRYTIGHAATELLPEDRTLAIAIWPIPKPLIRQVVSVALSDNRVRSALAEEPGAVFTAHVLPADYGMVDMFADVGTDHRMFSHLSLHRFRYLLGYVFPFFKPHRSDSIMGTRQENYTVIFSRVDGANQTPVPLSGITDLEAKMTPVVIAGINGERHILQRVVIPPRHNFWGDITMPMF